MAPMAGAASHAGNSPGFSFILKSSAMVLVLGGVTSLFGMRAPTWQHVDYLVRGEMACLAVQALVFAVSALVHVGPAFGNWLFAAVSLCMFALFAATFVARPRSAGAAP